MPKRTVWLNILFQVAAVLLALGFTTLVLVMAGAPPLVAYQRIIYGSLSTFSRFTDVLVSWIPLMLTISGLLITFSAGLWNIGIEGQVTVGAVFTTLVIRLLMDTAVPDSLVIALSILAGVVGGALWALLAGALKTFGGVNEIFGGLGLNFVATALTIWLIFGPWKRPGVASMAGTEPFPAEFSLPLFPDLRLSPWSLAFGILAIVIVYFLLRGTHFGLKLKAIGRNMRAAFLLGIPTWQHMMLAFLLCGAFAGLAGALQVTAIYHRLIPSISSGYGFLGLLVGMLINYQAIWAAPVALFFAALNVGSIQLPLVLKLDSSFSGVLQGVLVLFVLMTEGLRQRLLGRGGLRLGRKNQGEK
ncbi:MAG: ABC transporter permease [Chloroflexi bacterium]|nr:ABC transporter permease [Chloroflexota bacterium]